MKLVGRDKEITQIENVLSWKQRAQDPLTILSIEGEGGLGKTSLIEMAKEALTSNTTLTELGILQIYLDGSRLRENNSLPNFIELLIPAIKLEAYRHYDRSNIILPKTEEVFAAYTSIFDAAYKEIDSKSDAETIVSIARKAMSLGIGINKISNKTKDWFDLEKLADINKDLKIEDTITSFLNENPNIINKLGIGSKSKNIRNSIRNNAPQAFAEALVLDLKTILLGYDLKDINKPLPERIENCKRFLLIIDDYERLSESIGKFMTQHFLPLLKVALFESTVIISGRNELAGTDTAWNQHFERNLVSPIKVSPLVKEDIDEIAIDAGVDANRLWNDTYGYPFYIQLWIESDNQGTETAVFLQKFYDRITTWMNSEQKEWFKYCSFLDKVNKETLGKLLKKPNQSELVLKWFQREGSIRDTTTSHYTVRPYIRQRVKQYFALTDPDAYNKLSQQATELGLE
jgi:hypothetical protein